MVNATFRTKNEGITVHITQCHASNNEVSEEDKDQFYERLWPTVEKHLGNNLTILIEDPNAKDVMDNIRYKEIMKRHGLEEGNENGKRLAHLSAFNSEDIDVIILLHERIHKATWASTDNTTKNQINHIYINEKFRRVSGKRENKQMS